MTKRSSYGVVITYEKKYKGTSIGRNPKSKKTMNKSKNIEVKVNDKKRN